MTKPAHRRGSYHVRSMRLREAANADPMTRCWRCGKTLAQHAPHRSGRPAYWTAGHLRDGDPSSPLAPEASTCNFRAGSIAQRRDKTSRDW